MGFNEFLSSIFGNKSTRDMKEIKPWVEKIKAAYPEVEKLDNDALRAKTEELKKYIRESATAERAKVEELKASIESLELEDREEVFAQIDKIEKEILADNLQLAFIEGTPTQPDIHYIPYLQDEIVLVCAAGNSIPETVPLEELSRLCFVFREKGSGTYHIIKRQLSASGIAMNSLHDQLTLGTTEGIKRYLQYSSCFALLSIYSIRNELAADKLKIVEIEGLKIERTFYAIHRQGETDPYAQKFLDFAFRRNP